jgi:hypothetical protein
MGILLRSQRSIKSPDEEMCPLTPLSVLIHAHDLDKFCEGMADMENHIKGINAAVVMAIVVAPVHDRPTVRYKDSFTDFPSEKR